MQLSRSNLKLLAGLREMYPDATLFGDGNRIKVVVYLPMYSLGEHQYTTDNITVTGKSDFPREACLTPRAAADKAEKHLPEAKACAKAFLEKLQELENVSGVSVSAELVGDYAEGDAVTTLSLTIAGCDYTFSVDEL